MAFIDHPRSASALAVTITREIHISSEKHARNTSMAELKSPGALQREKQKRWKANPHPDNIVLPRKPPAKKKQTKDKALDPVDLTRRLNDHLRELKLRENGGVGREPLREMDWAKLRRPPRNEHSRATSRLDIRQEPRQMAELEASDYYTGPRPAPPVPRAEAEAVELYAAEMYAAYRQVSPRTESSSTGLYQHSQIRGTPLRKDSDTTGFYSESMESSEASRTSSRDSGAVERIKSFQGLPPLLFQTQSEEHFNTETTLSLESTFEKLEQVLTNTSSSTKSLAETSWSFAETTKSFAETTRSLAETARSRETFGPRTGDPIIGEPEPFDVEQTIESKKTSTHTDSTITASNRTTRTDASGETIQFVMRQSVIPQEPLPDLDLRNIHPLHRIPTDESWQASSPHDPVPTLTLNSAPSQELPSPREFALDRGRSLQIAPQSSRRSLSSDDTYQPIQQEVSYSYWRDSRPESWGPGDSDMQSNNNQIDPYLMDIGTAGPAAHGKLPNLPPKDLPTSQQPGPIKRVFGPMFAKNTNKPMPPPPPSPPGALHKTFTTQEEERRYAIPGVLPDDFPMQRKNFLGIFSSKR